MDDKPLTISGKQRGMVVFRPIEGGPTCSGLLNANGGFKISTGASAGLAPGDYMVSVRVVELERSPNENEPPTGTPLTPAVYADPLTSGLVYAIGSGGNDIVIKLASAAGPAVLPEETSEEDEATRRGPVDESVEDRGAEAGAEESSIADLDAEPDETPDSPEAADADVGE